MGDEKKGGRNVSGRLRLVRDTPSGKGTIVANRSGSARSRRTGVTCWRPEVDGSDTLAGGTACGRRENSEPSSACLGALCAPVGHVQQRELYEHLLHVAFRRERWQSTVGATIGGVVIGTVACGAYIADSNALTAPYRDTARNEVVQLELYAEQALIEC